jgi:hypothetical protein
MLEPAAGQLSYSAASMYADPSRLSDEGGLVIGGNDDDYDDEAMDEKLFSDVVNSMRAWKERQEQRRRKSDGAAMGILSREKRDEEVVCYGDLGCFRDEGPFDYLDMLPSPPEEVATKIFLYTR